MSLAVGCGHDDVAPRVRCDALQDRDVWGERRHDGHVLVGAEGVRRQRKTGALKLRRHAAAQQRPRRHERHSQRAGHQPRHDRPLRPVLDNHRTRGNGVMDQRIRRARRIALAGIGGDQPIHQPGRDQCHLGAGDPDGRQREAQCATGELAHDLQHRPVRTGVGPAEVQTHAGADVPADRLGEWDDLGGSLPDRPVERRDRAGEAFVDSTHPGTLGAGAPPWRGHLP